MRSGNEVKEVSDFGVVGGGDYRLGDFQCLHHHDLTVFHRPGDFESPVWARDFCRPWEFVEFEPFR